MANPQLENGHTKIANEIMHHLAKIHLSSNQWQVLICIIRKTYGFHKKVDYIANFQIVQATGLCKAVVSRTLEKLTELKIIDLEGKFIGFQKDWEQWNKLAIQSTKVSSSANNPELAISSTLAIKLAEQSTELAIQSTKVSSPAVAQKIKDTIQKKDNIYIYWNSLKIIEHKILTDSMKRQMKATLKIYSEDDIKKAMLNYSVILSGKEYFFKYKWTLIDFLQRGLEKFMDLEIAKQNYLKEQKKNKQTLPFIPGQLEKIS